MRMHQRLRLINRPAPFWGTLQNPEAHANSMSRAEAEAFVQRSHAETQAAILQHDADQLAAQKAAAERAAEELQLENDRRLIRELEELRALALAAPPPVLAPEMSGEQVPMFSQAELDAANFVPVPCEYPPYGQVVVAPADVATTPRRRSRPPTLSAGNKRPGRKSLAEMSALERHARKCKICRHKDREDIETDFLHWHDVHNIVTAFDLGTRRALYRHARATGLYEIRMSNIRDAAALIAARAENCAATASAVLKAIQACSQIDSLGRWIAPPTRTIRYTVIGEPQLAPSYESAREAAPAPSHAVAREAAPSSRPVEHTFLTPDELSTLTQAPTSALDAFNPTTKTGMSNRHLVQLETVATSTKQTSPHISNRPKSPTFLNSISRFFTPQNSAPNLEVTHR
jgi:hypothetical protein